MVCSGGRGRRVAEFRAVACDRAERFANLCGPPFVGAPIISRRPFAPRERFDVSQILWPPRRALVHQKAFAVDET